MRLKIVVCHTILTVVIAGITVLTLYAGSLDCQTGDLIADNRQCAGGGAAAGEQVTAGENDITDRILPPLTGAATERCD